MNNIQITRMRTIENNRKNRIEKIQSRTMKLRLQHFFILLL